MRGRRTISRAAAVAVCVLALCLAVGQSAQAVPVGPGSGGPCGSNPSGPYYWTAVYRDGSTATCGYYSQFQWMTDVKNADVRGFDHVSSYSSIYVRDGSTGAEVAAHFPTTCSNEDPYGRCPVTISVVHQGPGTRNWGEAKNPQCSGLYAAGPSAEYVAWGAFLEDIGVVEENTYYHRVFIAAPPDNKGNSVSFTSCGETGPV